MEQYCGNQYPYIFAVVPSDHKNDYLKRLSENGFRFYIASGKPSDKRIIEKAYAVLLLIDKKIVRDRQFRDTITIATRSNKQILCVYLEDVVLDACLSMQTEAQQALFRNRYPNEDELVEALKQAEIFKDMKVTKQQRDSQKYRSLSLVGVAVLSVILIFVFVIKPLLIPNTGPDNMEAFGLQGLSKAELESIEELRIIGTAVVDTFSHAWYENGDRTVIYWDKEVDGEMVRQETMLPGTIRDLTDLKQLKNLRELQIEGQQITDITPLFELKHLKSLSLNCNPISSLEGIETLPSLEWLDIASTDVTDVSPAFRSKTLRFIQIDKTYVESLDGIENSLLTGIQLNGTYVKEINSNGLLKEIWADGAKLTSIPDFKGANDVEFYANYNTFSDYRNLSTAGSYQMLQIESHGNSYELIRYLEGIPINSFLVAGLQIDDLNALRNLDIEEELNISHCSISSLAGIEHFEGITKVDLKDASNLRDLTPLLELDSLEQLTLSSDMKWMEPQLEERHFEIDYRDD